MRRSPGFILLASLILAGLLALTAGNLVPSALAQSLEVGGGARVQVPPDSSVNVRGEPRVATGNVVASAGSGDLLQVLDASDQGAFTWYEVETLPNAEPSYRGWIRGDLLTPALLPERTLPEELADVANSPQPPPPEPAQPSDVTPVPLAQRADWSRDLLALYPAIEGCVRVGSAPPFIVLRATMRNRGLAEVIIADSASRRWDCVISADGGTPIRYDPLSAAVFARDRLAIEPFFQVEEERPKLDPNCYRFERIVDPATGAHLGWLYYRTCP
jgi:hypothetical protein